MATNPGPDCSGTPHPAAVEGIRLFNRGEFFEAHEALEKAWRAEPGGLRDLYRGILQVAVTCLHITRGNYNGAVKVYDRSRKWLRSWPEVCRGIRVGQLRRDAEVLMDEVLRLGPGRLASMNRSLMRAIEFEETAHPASKSDEERRGGRHVFLCDRCGAVMHEKNCKVSCPNCGNRFDCSDLNIYFD